MNLSQPFLPLFLRDNECEFTPVPLIQEGDYVVLNPIEGSTFEAQEIFEVKKRVNYEKEDIYLGFRCVQHPLGDKHKLEHHGVNEEYYTQGYYPHDRKLWVIHPKVVAMIQLKQ